MEDLTGILLLGIGWLVREWQARVQDKPVPEQKETTVQTKL